MDDGHEPGFTAAHECFAYVLSIDDASPRRLDPVQFCAAPFGDIGHTSAEHTIDADDCLIAWFEEIHEAGFHPGATGAGNR